MTSYWVVASYQKRQLINGIIGERDRPRMLHLAAPASVKQGNPTVWESPSTQELSCQTRELATGAMSIETVPSRLPIRCGNPRKGGTATSQSS